MTINSTSLAGIPPVAGPTAELVLRPTRVLRLPRSPKVIAGLVILGVFGVLAMVGRWIAPYSPNATDQLHWVKHVLVPGTGAGTGFPASYYPLPLPPSAAHWLGTTVFAQDVSSQLLAATQATMFVGLLAAAIATVLSVLFGVTAGYLGGGTDEGLSLVANVFLAIPGLPLLIVLADYMPSAGSSVLLVAAIIAVTTWAYTSRTLGAQTLSLRAHVFAARAVELGRDVARGLCQQRGARRLVVVVGASRYLHRPARDRPSVAQLRHRRVHQPPASRRGPLAPDREEGRHQPPLHARLDSRRAPAAGGCHGAGHHDVIQAFVCTQRGGTGSHDPRPQRGLRLWRPECPCRHRLRPGASARPGSWPRRREWQWQDDIGPGGHPSASSSGADPRRRGPLRLQADQRRRARRPRGHPSSD